MKKRRFREFVANWLRENPHFWYSLLLLPIFICYFVPEQLIVTGYHPTQIAFDSMIPLLPGFVYCYLLWFPLLVFGGFWLLLTDGVVFRRYMVFLTVAYLISAAVYLSYPNGQDLRPTNLNVHDLSTTILAFIYRVDTNTNVLPSLHLHGIHQAARHHGCARRPGGRSAAVSGSRVQNEKINLSKAWDIDTHALF